MKARTTHLLAVATLTGILLAGTACGAPQAATQPVTTAPTATATAEPSPTATATTTASVPAATETAAPAPETPKAAGLETFTFPDGHVSFSHPAGWTVKVKPGPALNAEAQKTSFDATVSDASGTELAQVLSGMYGDGASGPAKRTILDHAPVPGVTDMSGEATEFGFAYDEFPGSTGGPYYFMDVRNASEYLATIDSSGSNQVLLPNGVLIGAVIVGERGVPTPAFKSPDAAKAWMGTQQYAQLKAMLLSLTYK
ncbi:hypothetical protein [Pseudarthrobacter sp. MM222]|uniref:hypothetical protein n=1 Tax=Pseudarthrobacter sp. MM222 TaxID=3018929 RepID=UPI00221F2D6F|nr:hypothetical protein [Pseudarthrobacter sp. MM222]CAI3800410.1 hypothetical protein NKCBBBOE_02579 [Pseudarthrobacter sp. MM222]